MKINFPKGLKKPQRKLILSIIQFGSSLRKSKYQDVDLAIVLKKNPYKNFLEIVYGEKFQGFDIFLIKEEVQGPAKFRFGGHGAHFVFSLIRGKALYDNDNNPFLKFKVRKTN